MEAALAAVKGGATDKAEFTVLTQGGQAQTLSVPFATSAPTQ